MDAEIAFGKVLRKLRREAGLSQENLALDAELDRTYVGTLEHGHHQPSLRTLLKLAQALNISTSRLMELIEQEMMGAQPGLPHPLPLAGGGQGRG